MRRILQLQSGNGLKGGLAVYIRELTSGHQSNNFSFYITISDKKAKNTFYSNNCQIINTTFYSYNFFNFISKLIEIKKIVKEYKIDLIHSHALRSGLLCTISKIIFDIKFIHTNHGIRFKEKKSIFKRFLFKIIELNLLLFSTKYVCIRETDYKFINSLNLAKIINYKKNKIKLIKTKITTPLYCAVIENKKEFPPHIINIGSLIPIKRPELFVETMRELKKDNFNFKSTLIGEGFLKPQLEKEIFKHDLPLRLSGQLPKNRVLKELSSASVFLSTSESEISPLAIKEAMWAGVPIISSKFYGYKDILNDENSVLYPCELSAYKLASLIKATIKNNKKIKSLRRRSVSYFWDNYYNNGLFNKEYFKIYESILKA